MKPPVISVIFSVYNGALYLREAIISILNQTYRDFEFIIVDDGSTDITSQILDEFTDDRIIRLNNSANLGLVTSLNRALAVAKGEIIARMDADDISLPDRFQKQLAYLEKHPEIGVLGTAMVQVDEQGRHISTLIPPLKHELILWQTLFGCAIFHATVMMRRQELLKAGGYDANFIHSEDLELWSRLFSKTKFANLTDVLYIRRLHRRSIISTQSINQRRDGVIIRQKLFQSILGYPVSAEIVEWLLNYNHSLTLEQKTFVRKLLQDLYNKISPIQPNTDKVTTNLQADLAYRLNLINQSQMKFFLRWIVLSFGKILPSPFRHKIMIWWNSLFVKNQATVSQPIKVVFIMNNFLIGGVEKLILDIIVRLDGRKFFVTVVTIFGSGPLENDFQKLNIPIFFAAGKLPFYANCWWYKILWLVLIPITFVRLIWLLCRIRPTTVITSLYQSDIFGIFAGWLVGVPKRALIHHDVYKLSPIKTWLKKNIGIRLATNVVVVSQTVKDFVISYFGTAPDRVEIIHNGINVEQFSNTNQPVRHSGLVVGMLGRLEPIKGPLIFTQALQILRDKYNIVPKSYLGGIGSLKLEIDNYIIQTKLTNLNYDGEIMDVPVWMNKIDILVVPSLSEGFGLVVLEGLAAGKVVIASDLPAIRELITDGSNGCLFPVGDAVALADMLHRLMTDSIVFNPVKQGIIKWQQQQLPDYNIKQVVQRYEKLLSGSDDQDNKGAIKP